MGVERRTILQVSGLVAVGGLVAACGGGDPAPSTPATTGAAGSGATGGALVKTADVPVGGGVILGDPAIVITQPTAGDFKAFTSICTHQGCAVSEVANNEISCPCHGSRFSATDGSVLQGPAAAALATEPIAVQGDAIVMAG